MSFDRRGLDRGRQEGGQDGFKSGFDFAMQLRGRNAVRREFPIGVVIWGKGRGEKVS